MTLRSKLAIIDRQDVGFFFLCLVSVGLILVGQLLSFGVFDSTGLDTRVPDVVIYAIVPAVFVTIVPAAVAARQYTRQRAVVTTGIVFVTALAAAFVAVEFWLIG
jgi:hypothetical protein